MAKPPRNICCSEHDVERAVGRLKAIGFLVESVSEADIGIEGDHLRWLGDLIQAEAGNARAAFDELWVLQVPQAAAA